MTRVRYLFTVLTAAAFSVQAASTIRWAAALMSEPEAHGQQ